jgi:3-methyladenine DNA glycosylase AlkD
MRARDAVSAVASARLALAELKRCASSARAASSLRFFRTGPGEYGEGDRMLGNTLPQLRALVRRCGAMPLIEIETLLESEWHEARLLALLTMVRRFARADAATRAALRASYLAHTAQINNWDLVDASAEHILGPEIGAEATPLLRRLARSRLLWERRIAMLATYHAIKRGEPGAALEIAGRLLGDEHDLIHKASGWMLREVGKRCDRALLLAFLDRNAAHMPRTALRYAIEHLPKPMQQRYLATPRARPAAVVTATRPEAVAQAERSRASTPATRRATRRRAPGSRRQSRRK